MIEQLFGSKTRVKLLQLFYSNPNRSFYVREITRKIDEQINSVRRELSNLLSIGIITSDTTNNKLYYEVNKKYEYFSPLTEIFGAPGSTGQITSISDDVKADIMPEQLKNLGHIELIIMTGQFTRDERSGVDLLLVGDINQTQLLKYIADLEKEEGKEIRYVSMNLKEYEYRLQINDRFLSKVLDSKKQILFDRNILNKLSELSEPDANSNKATKK